jgi:peptidoglycan/LPS O-acetylase OafA/YrhL
VANTERVQAIDCLRGVAALAVLLYHYVGFIPLMGIPVGLAGAAVVWATRYGNLGVPIFFVLSGYVIAMTASRYTFTPRTGGRFLLRRLVRIAPPYWSMIALFAGTLVLGHCVGLFRNTPVTAGQVVAHLVYAQDLLGVPPLEAAYWTLCLEVQFYLVFAVSAIAVRRLSPGIGSGWFAALTIGSAILAFCDLVPRQWFLRLWYQFGVGVLAYSAGRDRVALRSLQVLLPGLAGLGAYRGEPADIVAAALAGLLVFTGRLHRFPPLLLRLGQISYSLYLVHGFIGLGLGAAFRSSLVQSEGTAWVAINMATVAAIALAVVFHHVCERRGAEWSRLIQVSSARSAVSAPGMAVAPGPAFHRTGVAAPVSGRAWLADAQPTADLDR